MKETGDFQHKVLDYYTNRGRDLPWRKTTDPYAILVSEFMLQQTQVERVIPKFEQWLKTFPTVSSLANASLPGVLRLWSGLGYNGRGKRLHECAKVIMNDFGGKVPTTIDELESLPGIGPYTARAILIFAHNRDIATVDTNIRRILIHEFKLPETTSSEALHALAVRCVPKGRSRLWHNALMDYGATFLTSRKTGIRPVSRQPKFEGSNRWYRGKIMKLLTQASYVRESDLVSEYGALAKDALRSLEKDGLVECKGKRFSLKK